MVARTAQRSLELLSLLQIANRWSGPELARRLGVSLRTLRRDIDALRELGYPIEATGGKESTYHLSAGSALPPLLLDEEQAVAVFLALQTSPTIVLGLRDAANRAMHTLTQVMPAPLRAQVEATRVTMIRNYWEFSAPPIEPEILHAVGDAVRRAHLLRVDVRRPDNTRPAPADPDFTPPLSVEPHRLVLWAGRWYLLAHHPARARWRVYRVDRLHVYAPTGVRFDRRELPAEDLADYVMTRHDRGDLLAGWPCTGVVVLHRPAELVARFAPGGSVVEYVAPDRTRLTLGAWSWAGVAGILATFDADLEIVEPEELRQASHEMAARYAKV